MTSRRKDLTEKKAAYAAAGVPCFWAFDAKRRGVWAFAEPQGGDHAAEAFVPAGGTLEVPILGGTLDTGEAFPPASA